MYNSVKIGTNQIIIPKLIRYEWDIISHLQSIDIDPDWVDKILQSVPIQVCRSQEDPAQYILIGGFKLYGIISNFDHIYNKRRCSALLEDRISDKELIIRLYFELISEGLGPVRMELIRSIFLSIRQNNGMHYILDNIINSIKCQRWIIAGSKRRNFNHYYEKNHNNYADIETAKKHFCIELLFPETPENICKKYKEITGKSLYGDYSGDIDIKIKNEIERKKMIEDVVEKSKVSQQKLILQ